ncbi:MAG TPA: GNAT family protein [Nocardioides sp.]|nr:GNAT family protein [uncultured Nocardioides sp.]HEX5987728.1 GNAT family protein [Nocardioides sp.]
MTRHARFEHPPAEPSLPAGYAVRELRIDDAAALADAYDRNRDHLEPWDPVRPPDYYTEEGQREAISRQLSLVEGGLMAAWVIEAEDSRIVGRVNLNNVVRGVLQSGTVGYWVDAEHTRRGLASAGVEHACAQALRMGLHRVEAGTLVHNVPSQQVLLRAGFTHYGTAPKFLFIAGAWQDHHLYQRILHDDPLPFGV